MKPEGTIMAERLAARHCAELFRDRAEPVDCAATLGLLGERLARSLGAGLARLAGGDAPLVDAGTPQESTLSEIAADAQGLWLHSLIGTGPAGDAALLFSMDAAPVLRLLDRAFGGTGELPDPLPGTLPLSADLFAARLESVLAAAWEEALRGLRGEAPPLPVKPLRRDTSLAQIAPFPGAGALLRLSLRIAERDGHEWTITLAVPARSVPAFLAPPPGSGPARHAPRLDAEPFASLPVTLCATIAETTIGVARLGALKPGDVIPIAVARSVPIRAGGRTIAHGTIGELDDRVAIQINQTFPERP